jgi:hypothetical protein
MRDVERIFAEMIDAPAGDVLPKLTGKISPERIRLMRTPRPPQGLIEGFKRITDATSVVSDIMDELGITGVWATEITPVTGKWRIETVEINGDVQIAGFRVSPGDIVIADETGVCFIPIAWAAEVLERALVKAAFEDQKCAAIDAGTSVADLPMNA